MSVDPYNPPAATPFASIQPAPVNGKHNSDLASPTSAAVPQLSIHSAEKDLPSGRRWVVQKFGGTSVGKFAKSICQNIISAYAVHNRVAVVCSARSTRTKSEGTTNRAAREAEQPRSQGFFEIVETIRADHIQAAEDTISSPEILKRLTDEIEDECDGLLKILESAQHLEEVSVRAEDKIISKGEKLSCRFMAALLQDVGVNAIYIDLANVLRSAAAATDDTPQRLDEAFYHQVGLKLAGEVFAAEQLHEKPIVPVLTGYFGPIPGGLLPALGRGYTDLCAALLAVGLTAAELQIWKEVDGIFTADPRKVPTARLLPSVTPSEAAELTFYGSEVIHPFTMEQVIRARIPIRIKNVMNPRNAGTVIFPDSPSLSSENAALAASHSSSNIAGVVVGDGVTSPERKLLFRTRSSLSIVHAPTRSTSADQRDMPDRLRRLAIQQGKPSHPRRPTAVTIKHNITILNVHSNKRTRAHGFLMNIFNILDRHHLSVDLISSSEVHVSMALHSSDPLLSEPQDRPLSPGASGAGTPMSSSISNLAALSNGNPNSHANGTASTTEGEEYLSIANKALQAAVSELTEFGTIDMVPHCAIISLVGKELRNMVGVSGRFLSTLGREGINIEMISQGASEINISCVIEEREADRALNVVHTNLFTFLDD